MKETDTMKKRKAQMVAAFTVLEARAAQLGVSNLNQQDLKDLPAKDRERLLDGAEVLLARAIIVAKGEAEEE